MQRPGTIAFLPRPGRTTLFCCGRAKACIVLPFVARGRFPPISRLLVGRWCRSGERSRRGNSASFELVSSLSVVHDGLSVRELAMNVFVSKRSRLTAVADQSHLFKVFAQTRSGRTRLALCPREQAARCAAVRPHGRPQLRANRR